MAVGATPSVSQQPRDTTPNIAPVLAFAPVSAPQVTPPPTLEQCQALQKEIALDHAKFKLLVGGIGVSFLGMGAAVVGALLTVRGGAMYINNRIQDLNSGLRGSDLTPIALLAGGTVVAIAGVAACFIGILVAAAGASGINSPLSYFRAQWAYNTGGCRRVFAAAAAAEKIAATPNTTSERVVIETSDTIPTTINTPFEHPPMPEPWKVATAHMMRDVGQSFLNAGQQLADDVVPIVLTGAALAGGIVALRYGNTAPLQRALGF